MFIEAVVGLTIMALLAGSSADCSAPLATVPSPAGIARDGLESSTIATYLMSSMTTIRKWSHTS